jgi:hypothetical protein
LIKKVILAPCRGLLREHSATRFKVTKLDSGRVSLSEISALFLPMALLMATEIPSYYSEVFKRRGQHAGQTGQIYRQNCNELQKQS